MIDCSSLDQTHASARFIVSCTFKLLHLRFQLLHFGLQQLVLVRQRRYFLFLLGGLQLELLDASLCFIVLGIRVLRLQTEGIDL